MNILDELQEVLESRIDDWSETDRVTANSVAADLARLAAKELQGEDVAEELAIAKAAALNIAAGATLSGYDAMQEFVVRIGGKLLATL